MIELYSLLPIIGSLALAGILSGTIAGLLGVGGGIVNVPVLYFLFLHFGVGADSAMVIATGTSLAVIIPTSLSSIRSHHRRNNIDWWLIRRWLFFVIVGVLVGGWLVTRFDGRYFTLLFACLALFLAMHFFFYHAPAVDSHELAVDSHELAVDSHKQDKQTVGTRALPSMPYQGFLGAAIGFFSVMVGIGGGTLGVSILTAYGYVVHRAIGTSAVFGLLISLPGALFLVCFAEAPADAPVMTWGYINLLALVILVPLSVSFAPVGVWLGAKLDGLLLKKIFAIMLTITAVRMFIQVLIL